MPERRVSPTGLRLLVGLVSLPLLWWGIFGIHLMLNRPKGVGLFLTLILIITEDLHLAAGVFGVVSLIWAIAKPAWIERLMGWAWRDLRRAIIFAGLAVISIFAGVAAAAVAGKL